MSDLRIQYDEEMVGAGHPTKEDTLNRLMLAEHNQDGSHKSELLEYIGVASDRPKVEYSSLHDLAIKGCTFPIAGGFYTCPDLTISDLTLSADTWYFLYVSVPSDGHELTPGDFSVSAAAPTPNPSYGGKLYNGSARCIFAFYAQSNTNIAHFHGTGSTIIFDDEFMDAYAITPSDSWTDVTLTVPPLEGVVSLAMYHQTVTGTNKGTGYALARTNGTAWGGLTVTNRGFADVDQYTGGYGVVAVDGNGKIEVKFSLNCTNELYIRTHGFILPDNM